MHHINLFIDGSVNPQLKIGVGAYLIVNELSFFESKPIVKTKTFTNTSSTTLELQTLLWALETLEEGIKKLSIYTDCQNIIGLKKRCEKFEQNAYLSNSNKLIGHHELYKLFYKKIQKFDCEFIKIKGHKRKATKDEIDLYFTYVDTVSRKSLRELLSIN